MSDPQGPGPGTIDPHHLHHHYSFMPPKSYQNGISDLTTPHITILKNPTLPPSPWLQQQEDHPRLSDAFQEMRYLELNNWDLNNYTEPLTARLVDSRSIDSTDTQINYRPWEKPDSSSQQQQPPPPPSTPTTNGHGKEQNGVSSTNSPENKSPPTLTPLTNAFPTFTDTFQQPAQKLPSFQSQFNAFTDQNTPDPQVPQQQPPQPPTSQPQPPPSLPSFHTLPANRYVPQPNHRPEQQNFDQDRQIHIFPTNVHPIPPQFPAIISTQPHHPHQYIQMNGSNGYGPVIPSTSAQTPVPTLQLQELVPVPHTLLHPPLNVQRTLNSTETVPSLNLNLIENAHFTSPHAPPPHHTPQNLFQKYMNDPQQTHVIAVKLQPYDPIKQNGHVNGTQHQDPRPQPQPQPPQTQPTTPSKKKRKRQENGHDTAHQVSSVSSTESTYKRQNGIQKHVNGTTHNQNGHHIDQQEMDKPVKKKRKRCGECTGCQRKDNCGECAPCRNDKSHQICKQRRCDKLTEKKTPKSKLKQQQQNPQPQQIQQHHV